MTTAGIYVRISQDREGAGLGIARQEEDCRALCERRGWEVGEVYSDNDVSAYSGKPRPAWERLLADVGAGAISAVVCWHVDRLTRTPAELEHVIDLADRSGIQLATVTGEVDLGTPTGRMVARILGATARQEAEHKGERQKRQRRQAAEAGKVAGGGTRPFGFAEDRVTIDEQEAASIREAARRVLAGESLSSVCRDWAEQGVATPTGGRWQPRTLRRMLASARISGRREHTPRSAGSSTRPLLGDIVADAVWPAIITPDDSDRLRATLSAPSRQRYSSATGRTYLLSGLLRCGLCGSGLCGRPKGSTPRYVCPNLPGGTSCGRVATVAERTDAHVRDLVLVALESDELTGRLAEKGETPEVLAGIRSDEDQLDELATAWAEGEISRSEWQTARKVIEARLERSRGELARASARPALTGLRGTYEELVVQWDGMNLGQRRALVEAVVEKVDVGPANPRKTWDPGRFAPTWRV
ncbi:MAG: recombinase family protein [Iamia sp.]